MDSMSNDETLNAESISLVTVKPLNEPKYTEPTCTTRPQNESKQSKTTADIFRAAKERKIDVLKSCGEEDIIDVKDDYGASALHYAARLDNTSLVEELLDAGADINLKGPEGFTPLHVTARFNRLEVAEILINRDADPNIRSDDEALPLHTASRQGHTDIVHLLLRKGCAVNSTSSGRATPLILASMDENPSLCSILIENGADITAVTSENKTALHKAAEHGNMEVAKVLMKSASNHNKGLTSYVDVQDYEGNTALHLACFMEHDEMALELLKNGASPDVRREGSQESALHVAAKQSNDKTIKHLLDYNATNLDARDAMQRTPLHKSAAVNQLPSIKFFLDKGAIIDEKDGGGLTPFLLAVKRGRTEAAKELLDRGADIRAVNPDLKTCFHFAIEFNSFKTLEMLIEKDDGTLLEAANMKLQTPLHFAATLGDDKILSLLLGKGCQINAVDINEMTPLHLAALCGNISATDQLAIKSFRNVNRKDLYGRTPLHLAAQGGFRKTTQVLLDLDANTTIRDYNRRTPLHIAVQSGALSTVKTLLAGQDPHTLELLDMDENSALHLACANREIEIVKLLLDENADVTLRNRDGKTCLDMAIDWEIADVATALVQHKRWWEIMCIIGPDGYGPMKGLIEVLPGVAELVMDQSVEYSTLPSSHPDYCVKFNIFLLDTGPEQEPVFLGPTVMVAHNREDLLNHPLTQVLLRYKWFAFGKFPYYLNFLLFLVFTILFSHLIVSEREKITLHSPSSVNASLEQEMLLNHLKTSSTTAFCTVLMVTLNIYLLKELYQFFMLRIDYLRDLTNAVEITLYVCAMLFILPYLAGTEPLYYSPSVQWNAGVVALVMCYLNCMLFLRRIGQGGIYVSMYVEVLYTFIKVLLVFSGVILAAALVFFVLLKEEDNFSTVPLAFVRTTVMMIGELDYTDMLTDNVVNQNTNPKTGALYVPFPVMTYLVFFVFLILVPVILMNLLVGLAVGDIEAIRKSAFFTRMKDQVNYVEATQRRYPLQIKKWLYKPKLVIQPNSNKLMKSILFAGNSFIDTEYVENLANSKPENTNGKTKGDQETHRYESQKSKIRDLETKVDRQNKLLVAIGQKLGISDLDSL